MGQVLEFPLHRLPGAQVDHDHLDNFQWNDLLLADYANRARNLAWRYTGNGNPHASTTTLPAWPSGRCQDCNTTTRKRRRLGRYLLCNACAAARLHVRALIAQPRVSVVA